MSPVEPKSKGDTGALIGQTVNERFEVLSSIDSQGNARVFRVKDRHDSVIKAMKVVYGYRQENIERFLAEAERIKNHIKHPGLSQIHDFGVLSAVDAEQSFAYMVFDFLSGRSLYSILNRQGRIELQDALAIFTQVCEIAKHLHAAEISNIQLSPRKIIISEQGNRVRFSDPGLSSILKSLAIEPDNANTQFPEGVLYLSPEQCSGQAPDHRSDVYSIGCIMYESLVGLPPFLSKSPYEVCRMHINEEAKPLRMSRDDLNFPLELDLLVLKSLRKYPNQRQQNVSELLEDLEHVQQELAKVPEIARTEQHRSRNFLSDFLEDMSDLFGIDSTLRIKLAIPVILGLFLVIGSAWFGNLLNGQNLKVDSSSGADKEWQQLDAQAKRYFENGNVENAESSYCKALAIAEKFGDKDRRLLATLRNLQDVYFSEKRFDKADEVESRIKDIIAEDEDPN